MLSSQANFLEVLARFRRGEFDPGPDRQVVVPRFVHTAPPSVRPSGTTSTDDAGCLRLQAPAPRPRGQNDA